MLQRNSKGKQAVENRKARGEEKARFLIVPPVVVTSEHCQHMNTDKIVEHSTHLQLPAAGRMFTEQVCTGQKKMLH